MKVVITTKKGVPVAIIKKFNELTSEEMRALGDRGITTAPEYKNFYIQYNKHGELIRVNGYEMLEEKLFASEQPSYDLLDAMALIYGNRKQFTKAKKSYENTFNKKLTLTQKNIKKLFTIL